MEQPPPVRQKLVLQRLRCVFLRFCEVGCWRAGGVVAAALGEPSASPLLGAVGDGDDGGTVYDALEPKLAAIRASVQTVELLLRADAMITNQQVNAPERPPMLS